MYQRTGNIRTDVNWYNHYCRYHYYHYTASDTGIYGMILESDLRSKRSDAITSCYTSSFVLIYVDVSC